MSISVDGILGGTVERIKMWVEGCTGKVRLAAVGYVICAQELVGASLQRSEDALLSARP